ncbi:hypothetical protein ASJ83_02845 [Methanocorpusculum parvum]|uniref:Uncharacterized protein n=1 Tax=Methanocorpusculum parvum TaxID=2193 RepID=A0AAX0Q7W0_9EURY|nr:hypothetical protein ASJ83_02845 [Methanocorpusculum parvum]
MNISLTGGAGAPTGFARTVPMKGRAVVLIAGWTLKADNLSGGGSTAQPAILAEQTECLRLDTTSESEDQQIRFSRP